MKRSRVVMGATVMVLVGGAPLWANTTLELLELLASLERMHTTVKNIRGVTEDIRTKLQRVWPERALRPILTYLQPVRSIRDEIQQLSCSWQFSVRMERIRTGVFAGQGFCKREWEAVFGTPVPGWSKDLEDYQDWSAVRRMNAIGTHVTQNEKWAQQAAWLTHEAVKGTTNPADDQGPDGRPGYAQRLAALGSAQLGQLMVESGKLQAYELELAQERLNDKRRKRRLDDAFAYGTYRMLAFRPEVGDGMGPKSSPDLPLPEALR